MQAIFQAALQILETDGIAHLTTNRVAERAGVSIGTFYQYFNDKQDLLSAMAVQEAKTVTAQITEALNREDAGPRARAIARTLIEAYSETRTRRLLMELYFDQRGLDYAARSDSFMSIVAGRTALAVHLSPTKLFVLTRAVVGVVRAAAMEAPDLDIQALEDELVTLMRAYVTAETIR